MKKSTISSLLMLLPVASWAQSAKDSTDMYYQHLRLNEITVTGLTGESRLHEMPAPVSVVTQRELESQASTNIIDAIAHQPGVSQVTTGSGISKPVIRGLGYNRVAVVNDGIRQEGQQWGDEHGIEIDPHAVGSVEILKGPASLMYGSDAMAGVLIFKPWRVQPQGTMGANLSSGYQTNNGLFDYSVNFAGNRKGFVWDARWSQKLAHAYKNRYDGYVPGSQFQEKAARMLLGVNRSWGHSRLILSYYHLTPGVIEGERDPETGELEHADGSLKTYGRTLPFQQVYHYKAVWDNAITLAGGELKTLVGYQQNQRKEFEESRTEYGLYFQLHTLNYDIRYVLDDVAGWKVAVGAGGMYQRSMNKGEEYLIPAYRLFDVGAFATASRQVGQFHLTGGVRADRRQLHSEALTDEGKERFANFGRRFHGVSASVGAVWNLSERMNLRANISQGFRAPNMSELGSNGEHEGTARYEVGATGLKPERSWQADLGFDYNGKLLSAQVALFANRINNYIFLQRMAQADGSPVMQPTDEGDYVAVYSYRAGDAQLLGFEASADFHPIHQLHFENTFSKVDAQLLHQSSEMKYLPLTPAPKWSSELKYELFHDMRTITNSYVAVELECHLRQSHYFRAYGTETATPSYTLVNLSAGTDVLSHGGRRVASLYLSVNNLFDRGYQDHLSRLKYMDENALTGRCGVYNMGLNIALRVVVPIDVKGE